MNLNFICSCTIWYYFQRCLIFNRNTMYLFRMLTVYGLSLKCFEIFTLKIARPPRWCA